LFDNNHLFNGQWPQGAPPYNNQAFNFNAQWSQSASNYYNQPLNGLSSQAQAAPHYNNQPYNGITLQPQAAPNYYNQPLNGLSSQAQAAPHYNNQPLNRISSQVAYNNIKILNQHTSDTNDEENVNDDTLTVEENVIDVNANAPRNNVKKLIEDGGKIVSLTEIKQNETIKLGMLFDNYEKFQKAFQKYKEETCQLFAKQTSLLNQNNNQEDEKSKPYKKIIFNCIRSGDRVKTKGEDIR
jgi:hypothetical protein